MLSSRVVRTTALLLALLHAVVGAAGEALHYGIANPWAAGQPKSPTKKVVQYGHYHGPDFHWHVHFCEAEQEPEEQTDSSKDHQPCYRKPITPHEPHACPALALVDKLREAASSHSIDLPKHVTFCFLNFRAEVHRCRLSHSPYSARAPPADYLRHLLLSC